MKKKLVILILIFGMITAGISYTSPSEEKLFAHFNETGDPTKDFSSNGNDLSWRGDVKSVNSGNSFNDQKAVSIGKSDDYLYASDAPELSMDSGDNNISLSVWMNASDISGTDGGGNNLIIGKDQEWALGVDSNGEYSVFTYGSNINSANCPNVPTDTWEHVVFIWDESNDEIRVYINGNQKCNSAISDSSGDTGNPFVVGKHPTNNSNFKGEIDELHFSKGVIWNDTQIQNLYDHNKIETSSAPQIDNKSISPTDPNFNNLVNTSMNASDSDGDDLDAWLTVKEDGTVINDTVKMNEPSQNHFKIDQVFRVSKKDIFYNLTYIVSDGSGTNTTEELSQYISDSSPTFNVAKPENKSYGTDSLSWELNETGDGDDVLNENLDVTIYENGNQVGTDSITEGSDSTGSWTASDGSNTFKAEVSENDGDSTSKTVNYTVDTGFGKINITDPKENGTTKDLSKIWLNYTISNEPNLDTSSCQYSKDAGTNISISNCDNTTFQFGAVGEHNVTVWAKDTLGNWGTENNTWMADQENLINLTDKTSGDKIDDFQVTFDNGTETLGGSTSNGNFTWLTSKAPTGNVTLTLKSDSYVTRTEYLNITDSYANDLSYQMTRSGLELSAYDEQTNSVLDSPVVAEIRNSSTTKKTSWGSEYLDDDSSNWDSPGQGFDGDENSAAVYSKPSTGDNTDQFYIEGAVGFNKDNNTLYVVYSSDNKGDLEKVEVEKNGAWDKIDSGDNNDNKNTKTFTINNSQDEYSGKVRVHASCDHDSNNNCEFKLHEVYGNNVEGPNYDVKQDGIPIGNIKVEIDDGTPDDYQTRTYSLNLDHNSRITLRAYLLEKGEGIFISVETLNSRGESVSDALVNVQRSLGGSWRTVSQKLTGSDGSQSFYLDPDTQYKAVASHPNYATFEGTFSPTNYQYDPLQIQLGSSNKYNFSTRWDTVDYKITPKDRFLNKSQVENIEWTVTDGQSDLTEFGIRLKYRNGTLIKTDKIQSSPSGGTVNVSINGSQYSQNTEFLVEGYFISSGDEYRIEKIYEFARSWTAGLFSLDKILDTNGDGLNETPKGLFALIVTAVVGASLGKRFDRDGGGFIAVMVLGIFTIAKWFPLEVWTVTFLSLLGIYLYR